MPLPKPIFVHVHVPKTAGTSLNQLLTEWFKDQHLSLYHSPTHVYSPDELNEIVAKNPNVVSLASHSIRSFQPLLGGRPALYYCFLRNPIDRFISGLTFVKKNYRWLSEEHRQSYPDNVETMPLKDLVLLRLQKESEAKLKGNWLNRFFTVRLYRSQNAFLQGGNDLPKFVNDENEHFQNTSLPLAMAILDGFALVGLTEKFEDSVQALRALIHSFGLTIPPLDLPQANVSKELREDLSWITTQDELGRAVLRLMDNDILLYKYGQKRFLQTTEQISKYHFC